MTTRREFLVSTGLLAVSAAIPVLTPRNSALTGNFVATPSFAESSIAGDIDMILLPEPPDYGLLDLMESMHRQVQEITGLPSHMFGVEKSAPKCHNSSEKARLAQLARATVS